MKCIPIVKLNFKFKLHFESEDFKGCVRERGKHNGKGSRDLKYIYFINTFKGFAFSWVG